LSETIEAGFGPAILNGRLIASKKSCFSPHSPTPRTFFTRTLICDLGYIQLPLRWSTIIADRHCSELRVLLSRCSRFGTMLALAKGQWGLHTLEESMAMCWCSRFVTKTS